MEKKRFYWLYCPGAEFEDTLTVRFSRLPVVINRNSEVSKAAESDDRQALTAEWCYTIRGRGTLPRIVLKLLQ